MFLYVLVATIGMKMDIVSLIDNWSSYGSAVSIGLLWMLVHIVVLLVVAKIIRAPFFFVAVGSQANVGGAASAPIVASAFSLPWHPWVCCWQCWVMQLVLWAPSFAWNGCTPSPCKALPLFGRKEAVPCLVALGFHVGLVLRHRVHHDWVHFNHVNA